MNTTTKAKQTQGRLDALATELDAMRFRMEQIIAELRTLEADGDADVLLKAHDLVEETSWSLAGDGSDMVEDDACPGCGCKPGDGATPGCTDPVGCGFAS